MTNANAVLDRFTTDDAGTVTEVTFDVTGGSTHNDRRDAALDALEAFTDRSARPVCTTHYEVLPAPAPGPGRVFRFFAG